MTTEREAGALAVVGAEPRIIESRWPPVLAVLVFMALHITVHVWLQTSATRVPWLVPAVEAALVAALLTVDPRSTVDRHRRRLGAVVLVGVLVCAALGATTLLIDDLIQGTGVAQEAGDLLAAGAVVWLGNNLAFGLLYWLMDAGGPIARANAPGAPDFAFTQQMSPEVAPAGWRPVFLDYLHLGFTNALAFSPTDVMPLSLRAKYAMLVQSTVALALFALVVARAVNAFT